MKIIKLELDFLIGPIIKDVFSISKNKLVTGVDVIDNDSEINNLNDTIIVYMNMKMRQWTCIPQHMISLFDWSIHMEAFSESRSANIQTQRWAI